VAGEPKGEKSSVAMLVPEVGVCVWTIASRATPLTKTKKTSLPGSGGTFHRNAAGLPKWTESTLQSGDPTGGTSTAKKYCALATPDTATIRTESPCQSLEAQSALVMAICYYPLCLSRDSAAGCRSVELFYQSSTSQRRSG
jgi:hypothetical protein